MKFFVGMIVGIIIALTLISPDPRVIEPLRDIWRTVVIALDEAVDALKETTD